MAILLVLAWFYIVIHGASSNKPYSETTDCEDYSDKYTCNGTDNKYICDCYNESVCYFQLLLKRDHNSKAGNGTFISVNGRFQGPTLIVEENATVVVDVVNEMDQETSIHWHGTYQTNTPRMDGVNYITQWPIEPGHKFRYIFKAKPSGTLWYHSHTKAQRAKGLFGAVIVKERVAPPLDIPFEDKPGNHTMIFVDFLSETLANSTNNFKSLLSFFTNNLATNGKVPFYATCSSDGSKNSEILFKEGLGNGLAVEVKTMGNFGIETLTLSSFNVQQSKTYRLRLIGAQQTWTYRFSIDDHQLTVIATDGHLIQPYMTDYIVIHGGERYDFLLTANSTAKTKLFPIRIETLEVDCKTGKIPHYSGYGYLAYGNNNSNLHEYEASYLRKQFSKNPKNCWAAKPCKVVNCPFKNYPIGSGYICHNVDKLKLLISTPTEQVPKSKEIRLERTMFFNFFGVIGRNSTSNGRQFGLPPIPLQGQNYSELLEEDLCEYNASECFKKDKRCIHIAEISSEHYLKSFRFVLSSLSEKESLLTHPIHLHGHSFYVVKVGYPTYHDNGTMSEPSKDLEENASCKNPPKWANDTPPDGIAITNYTVRK